MKDIIMPRFDPEMKSGKVVEWLKKEGEKVAQGEPVVRIDTEKVSIDVEAPVDGILSKILIYPVEEVAVGTPLGSIASPGENAVYPTGISTDVSGIPASNGELGITAGGLNEDRSTVPDRASMEDRPNASPSARRIAKELDVDLRSIKGTGPHGRITSEDVEKYHQSALSVSQGFESHHVKVPLEEQNQPVQEFVVEELDVMRRIIADRMAESWSKIPQVPLFLQVNLLEADKFRSRPNEIDGRGISLTSIVVKALGNSLESFPDLNVRFESEKIHRFKDVDVSIAVALERGLITPVVRKVNLKSLIEVSSEIEDLAQKARDGRLTPAEVRGGTTSVSSLAGFGVDFFVPIINPPQATIVGVGRKRKSVDGESCCTITLVFDHRVTDGARAAKLLEKLQHLIENPQLL